MGIDPEKIDPRKLKIYGNGGGMLPQPNNVTRISDLQENPILINGQADGKFDKQDYLLFYAEGPDKITFEAKRNTFLYQNNLYSDKNFYFLTVSDDPGKRIAISEDLATDAPVINTFNDYFYHETDEYNSQQSGREWFGEVFKADIPERSFPFSIQGITSGSPITVVSAVMGESLSNASFKLLFNDVQIHEQLLLPISNSAYGLKGYHKKDTIYIQATDIGADSRANQEIKYQFIKGPGDSKAYLDYFLVSFERNLALYKDQTTFLTTQSLSNPVSKFEIHAMPEQASVWDITDHFNIRSQDFSLSNGVATFSVATGELKKYIVFNHKIPAPVFEGKVANQDLHGIPTPNLIIVTHPTFKAQAERLAAHREQHSNWQVRVVTTAEVFNEFSSGRQDVTAIRDFVKHLYDKGPSTLRALLLMGKCSYDFKDRTPNNTNYVITYESRNSLHKLQTFSSDDYFTFLESNEGNWGEDPVQNHTLDIGVGRLPVTTKEQAANVVDKIIYYDTNKKSLGAWRKQIVFIADDGSTADGYTSLHQYQADQLAQLIEKLSAGTDTRKLFMGTYPKTVRPNGETIPKLTDDVVNAFDRGSLIINYTGHGSERQWGDESFFNNLTITDLKNKHYPFLVTATCEFGRHDNPAVLSGAERTVIQANAGSIGLVTTARPVNATTNFNLNEAFYEALFQHDGNGYFSMGEVFRRTKNNSTSGISNRNFSLLGDPSLFLALPPHAIKITGLKTATGSDTLKALSTVIAKGEIRDYQDQKLTAFNGILEATLFDKESKLATTGRNNPAFSYSQWDNVLFRGKATVKNGEFEFRFMVPKNIAYQVAGGKLSMYAYDPKTGSDASGFEVDFKIGESDANVVADVSAPQIQLYMQDSTFVNGGITAPDTYLVAYLSDNTGINISNYGIGNSIMAILDDSTEALILNDYYIANQDDYSSGWLKYPLNGLSPGRHTLTLKAWDVFNNGASSTIEFIVTDGNQLVIESFGNYPNPFKSNTTLFFTHNRSGDDLQAHVFIQTVRGEVVKSGDISIPASDYRVNLMELNVPGDIDKKLSAGLYLVRLIVRSLTNGSKNEQVTKLIVLN